MHLNDHLFILLFDYLLHGIVSDINLIVAVALALDGQGSSGVARKAAYLFHLRF